MVAVYTVCVLTFLLCLSGTYVRINIIDGSTYIHKYLAHRRFATFCTTQILFIFIPDSHDSYLGSNRLFPIHNLQSSCSNSAVLLLHLLLGPVLIHSAVCLTTDPQFLPKWIPTEGDVVFPLTNYSILSFPEGNPLAPWISLLLFSSLPSCRH